MRAPYAVDMKQAEANPEHKETTEMTRHYLRIARYFLSTAALAGFGGILQN